MDTKTLKRGKWTPKMAGEAGRGPAERNERLNVAVGCRFR